MKRICGKVSLFKDDLLDSDIDYMSLEYFKIKDDMNQYGLEVTKKEYFNNKEEVETCSINNLSTNEAIIDSVIKAMQSYKVTPCTLKESVVEYLKMQNSNINTTEIQY